MGFWSENSRSVLFGAERYNILMRKMWENQFSALKGWYNFKLNVSTLNF